MASTIEAFAHGGETWALREDTEGRVYAFRSRFGRCPREQYDRAKANACIDDFEEPETWEKKARENIQTWGNQEPVVLLLALVEELAEAIEYPLAGGTPNPDEARYEYEAWRRLEAAFEAGMASRRLLEGAFEDDEGSPLPEEERPVISWSFDEAETAREVDDVGPLVYQLAWALDDGGKSDD